MIVPSIRTWWRGLWEEEKPDMRLVQLRDELARQGEHLVIQTPQWNIHPEMWGDGADTVVVLPATQLRVMRDSKAVREMKERVKADLAGGRRFSDMPNNWQGWAEHIACLSVRIVEPPTWLPKVIDTPGLEQISYTLVAQISVADDEYFGIVRPPKPTAKQYEDWKYARENLRKQVSDLSWRIHEFEREH